MTGLVSLESWKTVTFLIPSYSSVPRLRFVGVACALGAFYAILNVAKLTCRRIKPTVLQGPSNPSFLWGVDRVLVLSPDPGKVYEEWAEEYGGVYQVSLPFGGKRIVLCDPKAIAHLWGGESWTYVLTHFEQIGIENLVGKSSILTAKGENHLRQRKALIPALSNAAIRHFTPVFYNSAYKVKGIWDSLIEADGGGGAVIEVQNWMCHVSFDTIGIAGFSHHFGSLDGEPTPVTEVLRTLDHGGGTFGSLVAVLAQALPWVMRLPMPLSKLVKRLNYTMGEVSDELIAKARHRKEASTLRKSEEASILGFLIRAEKQDAQHHLTREEVTAQAKVLLLAGYGSTSLSLTWALIELARNPDIQNKLRTELLELGADPSYDQLSDSLPYLDAVVHETLRLHPPIPDVTRMATVDDVIPLSKPVRTRSGEYVDSISVTKGTFLSVSVSCMNRSKAFWGPDSKAFNPERWVRKDGIPAGAKEIQGHRHLLTFIDGPRTCPGKGFAIAELKIVLSVLLKHFVFEFRDGPDAVIETVRGILPRLKVAGEEGTAVPLRVKPFELDAFIVIAET